MQYPNQMNMQNRQASINPQRIAYATVPPNQIPVNVLQQQYQYQGQQRHSRPISQNQYPMYSFMHSQIPQNKKWSKAAPKVASIPMISPQQASSQMMMQSQQQPQQQQQPPPNPTQPPNVAPNNAASTLFPESIQKLNAILSYLGEDKVDLLFRLFGCPHSKKREERQKQFIKFVVQLYSTIPNSLSYVLYFAEQLQSPAMCQKLKEVPYPPIFNPAKGCKLVYRNVALNYNGFEYSLSVKEKKYIAIGTFICANEEMPEQYPICKLLFDNMEIHCHQYGTNEHYFMLTDGSNTQQQINIQFTNFKMNNFLTWFVIRFVELKTSEEIVSDIAKKRNTIIDGHDPYVKTVHCKDCAFRLIDAVEQIIAKGYAKCPMCESNVVFDEIIFVSMNGNINNNNELMSNINNKKQKNQIQIQPKKIIEENKEEASARNVMAEQLRFLVKMNVCIDWDDLVFGDDEENLGVNEDEGNEKDTLIEEGNDGNSSCLF
ncbi:hypothetical protein GPJ56_004212 [Histomonas meleagridis]|uniref:uncharacterized protein n=1 Tax=Histomonas meleagridis TaxID=135588 RepID=UPI003559EEB5|nr:hypothetical protein GPJ56_004212 [Histomonas meleagridis]KAH0802239.1 hypothetical protein GO595_004852 [Histomonas meleagridis]